MQHGLLIVACLNVNRYLNDDNIIMIKIMINMNMIINRKCLNIGNNYIFNVPSFFIII